MSDAEKKVRNCLRKAALFTRLRRCTSALAVLLSALGLTLLVLRAFGVIPIWAREPELLVWFSPLLIVLFGLPVTKKHLCFEIDCNLNTGELFSAYMASQEQGSRFAELIAQRCSALAAKSPVMLGYNLFPARTLALFFLGAILGASTFLIPSGTVFTKAQVLAAIVNDFRLEQVSGATSSSTEDTELDPLVQQVIDENIEQIVRMLKTADVVQAIEKMADTVKRLGENNELDSQQAEEKLKNAGIDEDKAKYLSSGNLPNGFNTSAISAGDLHNAAEALGTGQRSASLAKAAEMLESGEAAHKALAEAARLAKQLADHRKFRVKLANLISGLGKEVFDELPPESQEKVLAALEDDAFWNKTQVTAGNADISSLKRESEELLNKVTTSSYPLEYRIALFSYFSPPKEE